MSESETSPDINAPRGSEKIPDDNSKLNKHSHSIDIDADDDPDMVGRLDRAEIDADDDPDLLSQQVNVDIDPDDDPDLVGKRHSSDIDPDDDPDMQYMDSHEVSSDDTSSDKLSARQRLINMGDRLRGMLDNGDDEPSADDLERTADELKEAAQQKRLEEEAYRATEEEVSHEEELMGNSGEKFVKLTAERTRHLFERSKTREQINNAKEEASDALAAIATSMYLELSDAGVPEDEIVRQIDEFVAGQADEMANQMEAEYKAEYDNASPVMKRLYDKWSLWGEQGMKGKIKKAAVLAPGLIAIGAAGSVAGGAVLGGAAGVGIALLGKSVGRQLLRNKLDRASNVDEHAAERVGDFKADAEVNAAIFDALDASSDKYRKRNRNRMIGGVAVSMVAGAALGGAAGFVGDVVRDHVDLGKVGEKLGDAASAVKGKYEAFQADRRDGGLIDSDFLGEGPESTDTPLPADVSPDTGGPDVGSDGGPAEAPTPTSREAIFDGFHATRELTPDGKEAILDNLNNYKVQPGDTIWDVSEKMLEEQGMKNPSVYEIDATKDFLIRELQDQGYADSRGWLNAGDTIKLR